ncbi:hypothetical protein HID58_094170, partial [Brassica napus]
VPMGKESEEEAELVRKNKMLRDQMTEQMNQTMISTMADMLKASMKELRRGRYGRPYGWYGLYGHDQLKTDGLDHLKLFEGCANIGHWCTSGMVRSIKWNQEDALVARRFKQELAPCMGSMGLVRMVHDRLATAGKEEQARLCIWTVKRADTQALLTILSLIQSGAYKQLVKHQDIKWNQEDALVARRFKQELAPSMGSMGLVRMVHDRLATAGKEEQARLCIWTVKRADTQALLTILSLIQSGAYKQLVKHQE